MKVRCISEFNALRHKFEVGEEYFVNFDNRIEIDYVKRLNYDNYSHLFEEIHTDQIGDEFIIKKSEMNIPSENVSHPPHYNQGKYEAIDVIKDWKLNFNLGNVIKYIARADYKGDRKENLEKALFYLKYELGEIND